MGLSILLAGLTITHGAFCVTLQAYSTTYVIPSYYGARKKCSDLAAKSSPWSASERVKAFPSLSIETFCGKYLTLLAYAACDDR